jgi:hypothetical protein
LELHRVQVNQRLQGELRVCNVEVCVDEVLDFLPMRVLQVIVSQGNHDWHGTFEGVHELLQVLLNGILLEVLFKADANLGELVGFGGDLLSLNAVELSLDPLLLQVLPFLE